MPWSERWLGRRGGGPASHDLGLSAKARCRDAIGHRGGRFVMPTSTSADIVIGSIALWDSGEHAGCRSIGARSVVKAQRSVNGSRGESLLRCILSPWFHRWVLWSICLKLGARNVLSNSVAIFQLSYYIHSYYIISRSSSQLWSSLYTFALRDV